MGCIVISSGQSFFGTQWFFSFFLLFFLRNWVPKTREVFIFLNLLNTTPPD